MKLLLDENLSKRIISLIAPYYPGSSQITLLELERASDTVIWNDARQHEFVIVTKDRDFLDLSTLYGAPPKIILLKSGNQPFSITAQTLIDHRELLASALIVANVVYVC